MTRKNFVRLGVLAIAAALGGASAQRSESLAGIWDASVVVNGAEVPFRMEIAGNRSNLKGSFFNGDERVTSTRGRRDGSSIVLEFDQYAAKLEATLADGRLEGRYDRGSRGVYAFRAKRFTPVPLAEGTVPSIAGLWNVQVKSSKGESAWRLIVRQAGPEIAATVLRVDGDTGMLTGTYRQGTFILSHFSGARPSLFELTPARDGTLTVVQRALQNGPATLVAIRDDDARAAALPQPSDPTRFTSVKDPTEPLRFSFPDLDGRIVSSSDSRFAGKVVIVSISGSWCPNCHDEAPFLAELYRTYRSRGLEIVTLSFEEPEQLQSPTRLRAFIKQYRIEYPVLVAGKPEELNEKLPQAVNLNSFPTAFFVGRDGLVRGAHAGFPGAASGRFHAEAKAEITRRVEALLAERARTSE